KSAHLCRCIADYDLDFGLGARPLLRLPNLLLGQSDHRTANIVIEVDRFGFLDARQGMYEPYLRTNRMAELPRPRECTEVTAPWIEGAENASETHWLLGSFHMYTRPYRGVHVVWSFSRQRSE